MINKYDDKTIILEIIKIIDKLVHYANSVEVKKVNVEDLTVEAMAYNFQLLSTFSKRVSTKIRNTTDVKWYILDLYGEVLVHATFGIEYQIMFEIVINEFQILKSELTNIIRHLK